MELLPLLNQLQALPVGRRSAEFTAHDGKTLTVLRTPEGYSVQVSQTQSNYAATFSNVRANIPNVADAALDVWERIEGMKTTEGVTFAADPLAADPARYFRETFHMTEEGAQEAARAYQTRPLR